MKSQLLKSLLLVSFIAISLFSEGQNKVYNPDADAKKDVANAVIKASKEGKHVFVKIGGNWCPWCILFHEYSKENKKVHSILSENYVEVLVSARENKELLKTLGNPGRFGYPVFVILNQKGKVIHIQDSGMLEAGKGYDEEKVSRFLLNWTVEACR